MPRNVTRQDRRIAFWVFGLLLSCYLLTYTGTIQSSDGLSMFATVESMVRRGEIDSNQLLWMGLQQGSYGPDGELYSRKGLGMPLLTLPLIWLAQLWSSLGLVHTALLLNPLLTAWTGALIYRSGCRLGWPRSASILTALIFGLATLAWPYTQTFFSDPISGWGLFGALYGILSFRQTGRKRYLALGGIAWGIAYLSRVINLITLPIYIFALFFAIVERYKIVVAPNSSDASISRLLSKNWRPFTSFLFPIIAAGIASLWWNWIRYGNILDTGYAESERFNAIWGFGISGLLIGPARGLLWYSPILLLAIFGVHWFWRNQRWIFGTSLSIAILYILVYGKWYMWHGGFSWGPRFMVPLMPFLSLLCGPIFASLFQRSDGTQEQTVRSSGWRTFLRSLVIGLIVLSILIQWLGMLISFGLVQNWLATAIQPLFAPETFTQVQYSPLLLQWEFIDRSTIQFAWWQTYLRTGRFDWLGLLLPLVGIAIGLFLIIQPIRRRQDLDISAPDPNLPSTDVIHPFHNWLYGIALCAIILTLLAHYQSVLGDIDNRLAVQKIQEEEQAGDAILHLLPTQTQQFANVYHGTLPVYGLFPQEQLHPHEQVWLDYLRQNYQRLWVIPDHTLPQTSGWEYPLRAENFLLWDGQPAGDGQRRLALYYVAQELLLTEAGLGAIFGYLENSESEEHSGKDRPISQEEGWARLLGYAFTAETTPGQEILLVLRWQDLRPIDYNYHVFVHLLDESGRKVAQRDGQPVLWMRPTSTWQPGEEITDHYGLLLAKDFPMGQYTLIVGLYDPISGQRVPVSTGIGENAIRLGPIEVKPNR